MKKPRVFANLDAIIAAYRQTVGDSACWLWKRLDPHGYGVIDVPPVDGRRRKRMAAAVVWEHLRGPIPDGLEPDHLCRVHACANPAHVALVTHRENVLRGTGFAAINARKTHCPKGHPLRGKNLVAHRLKRGERICRICNNETLRRSQKRRAEADPDYYRKAYRKRLKTA